jgi:predicted dinucleotide-binding enzyme
VNWHRTLVVVAAAGLLLPALAAAAPATTPAASAATPLKIGIIGTGEIGGTLATLWVAAGHEVLISSRHPDQLQALARSLGPKAHVGTPREAAVFGDVVLVSVPYAAEPQVGRDLRSELTGKIVLDTGNPYPGRDGEMAVDARKKGTGVASAEFFPACAWCAPSMPSTRAT